MEGEEKNIDPDDVLGAVLSWVNHDSENRGTRVEELIKNVQLEKCSMQCQT